LISKQNNTLKHLIQHERFWSWKKFCLHYWWWWFIHSFKV